MTAKEKAKDLIDKHLTAYDIYPIAINSALITINELLEATKIPTWNSDNWNEQTGFRYDEYLLDVKKEIEDYDF